MQRDDTDPRDISNNVRVKQCSPGRRLRPMAKWTDPIENPEAVDVTGWPNLCRAAA